MTVEALETQLRTRLDPAAAAWLTGARAHASSGTAEDLLRAYTDASRHLGRAALLDASGDPALARYRQWSVEDAGRLLLVLARFSASAAADRDRVVADVISCYEQGDTREQQSWLRSVALLPEAERYLPLVIDACRTNILPLFTAVACENPYPARYFPERNFNQMVLKALFNGVALARIEGLGARANPELARMATDYAAERRAAGRSIPADIGLATAPQAT